MAAYEDVNVQIEEARQGAVTVIRPVGALTGDDARVFGLTMEQALVRSLGRLVLDASGISVVDSKGLEALAEVSERLGESGQGLRLCGANETVREVLELTELTGLFEHYADVHTGVRSFL